MRKILYGMLIIASTAKGQTIIQDSTLHNQTHVCIQPKYEYFMSDTTDKYTVVIETGITLDNVKCTVLGFNKVDNPTFTKVIYIPAENVESFWQYQMRYAYLFCATALSLVTK